MNIGNLFIVGFQGPILTPEIASTLKRIDPAGVIFFDTNIESREQVIKLVTDLKDLLGENLLISVDQEGGRVQRLRKVTTPLCSLRQLGAAAYQGLEELPDYVEALANVEAASKEAIITDSNLNLLTKHAEILCKDLLSLGFNYDYAPCVDLDTNPNNPVIGERSLGSDPKLVSEQVSVLVREYKRHGLLTCAKHFPGHGDTDLDSHLDLPVLDYEARYGGSGSGQLNDQDSSKKLSKHAAIEYEKHLAPFRAAIEAGVDSVMIGHLLVKHLDDKLPASLSSRVIQGELRERLGYQGLVISDELTMKALSRFSSKPDKNISSRKTIASHNSLISHHYSSICKQALIAGNNLVIWNVNLEDAATVALELSVDADLQESYSISKAKLEAMRS